MRFAALFAGVLTKPISPAYDMNPSIDRRELSLAINEVDTACDVSIAMDAHKDYGLSSQQAERVRQEVQIAVASWRGEANRLRISKTEQDLMAAAFEL
jgi:serine/threonine-protein kinase HipA